MSTIICLPQGPDGSSNKLGVIWCPVAGKTLIQSKRLFIGRSSATCRKKERLCLNEYPREY
jgi:hypothetical protein